MKKRSYRRIPIKLFSIQSVTATVPRGRLVFSVDVAKTDMVAGFADDHGQVAAFLSWKHPQDNVDLLALLRSLQAEGYAIEAVMESSGTYGDVLRQQMHDLGVSVFKVSGKRTHDAREIYDGVPSLHDAKCAAIIAKLHVDGISLPWPQMTDDKRKLKAALALMDLFQERYLQLVHRLESWLARYWPELPEILELTSASLMALLARIGGPRDVAAAPDKSRRLLRGMSHGLMDPKKIDTVIAGAGHSCGVPMLDIERQALAAIAQEAHTALRAFKGAKANVEVLAIETPARHMATTVGKATAALFISEVGDPALFPSASAYLKAFGLNLKEKSSGTHQGHLRVTKRGSGRARQYLWLAVFRWIQKDPIAKAWYQKKIARDAGKKAKAVVAMMRKLARALFHVGRGEPYDGTKLFDVVALGLQT
jgi:transposase